MHVNVEMLFHACMPLTIGVLTIVMAFSNYFNCGQGVVVSPGQPGFNLDCDQFKSSVPSPPLDNIRVMVIVWRLRGNIISTVLCWIV